MPPLPDRSTWLHGDPAHCLQPPTALRPWRLVLLGPPGVGKGTQSGLLAHLLGACPLSTGDLFRAAYDQQHCPGSALAEALERVRHGQLVPDDIVLGLIRNRRTCLRCSAGFLLDGFPRTLTQALALDGLLALDHIRLDAVLCYELPVAILFERMTGRRVCSNCHALFHETLRPPFTAGVCDKCGWPLEHLPDDQPDAVRSRLIAYGEATTQVARHYERQGLLLRISAQGSPENILHRTLALLLTRGFRLTTPSAPPSTPAQPCSPPT